jgi:hypothetical protein
MRFRLEVRRIQKDYLDSPRIIGSKTCNWIGDFWYGAGGKEKFGPKVKFFGRCKEVKTGLSVLFDAVYYGEPEGA